MLEHTAYSRLSRAASTEISSKYLSPSFLPTVEVSRRAVSEVQYKNWYANIGLDPRMLWQQTIFEVHVRFSLKYEFVFLWICVDRRFISSRVYICTCWHFFVFSLLTSKPMAAHSTMSSSNIRKIDATTQQKGRNHLQTEYCQIVLETRHRNFEAPIFVFHFAVPTTTLH